MAFIFWALLSFGLTGALVFSSQIEFLVPALASILVMALSLIPGLGPLWGLQTLIWLLLSASGLYLFRNKLKKLKKGSRPAEDAVAGHRATVVEVIDLDSPGRVRFLGTTWSAASVERLEPGTEVVILEQDGLVLQVERSSEARANEEWKALEEKSDPKEG